MNFKTKRGKKLDECKDSAMCLGCEEICLFASRKGEVWTNFGSPRDALAWIAK